MLSPDRSINPFVWKSFIDGRTAFTAVLSSQEIAECRQLGELRHRRSLEQGRRDAHGFSGDPLRIHIEGAYGECAFCLAFDHPWVKTVDTFKAPDFADDIQVRARLNKWTDLIYRPDDDPLQRFVLVTGKMPILHVRGWLFGYECRRLGKRACHGNRPPAWFTPARSLRPIETFEVESMLRARTMKRIKLICSSCDNESEALDVPAGRLEQQIDAIDQVFSRIGWLVDRSGAWCLQCKGMPR